MASTSLFFVSVLLISAFMCSARTIPEGKQNSLYNTPHEGPRTRAFPPPLGLQNIVYNIDYEGPRTHPVPPGECLLSPNEANASMMNEDHVVNRPNKVYNFAKVVTVKK
ncbi:uncharacterized protein LOC107473113 isoform X2 [Arachis duranensis]|uniref:Uncharacterized protein LOC107473113 isoform X2 n=1 Tax=Arachis duranensis TaxID=130453 RepID=A0A6P5N372_ARADU|nr:uncharacterized protein LOC107473113 isoform X2 [Arachis duranensis]